MYTYIRKGLTLGMGWTMEELVQILAVVGDFSPKKPDEFWSPPSLLYSGHCGLLPLW